MEERHERGSGKILLLFTTHLREFMHETKWRRLKIKKK